jgi:YidC/Oxa1 family membrane protein insertase
MLANIWNIVLYKPLLNALAFLVSTIPGGDIGLAVIILTLFVKIILLPLSQRSIESQIKMNSLAPLLKKIKDSGASKEEQAKKTFELYKTYKTNPFSGCLLVLIQIPIIFALYYVFLKELNFDNSSLYSFINIPEKINMNFLGLVDISKKGILVLAVLAGVSQFFQAYFMPKPATNTTDKGSFQDNLSRSMQTQMKYIFPFVVAFIAYSVSGAIALYWITSNTFAICQQLYANKKSKNSLILVEK